MSRPRYDERDEQIRMKNRAAWDAHPGPRVGDWCIMPDGEWRRFTHDWGDGLQTTYPGENGSFYFGEGYMSYSGSLDHTIPAERIAPVPELSCDGTAWFFHHNHKSAHNGVYFDVPCRVFVILRDRP